MANSGKRNTNTSQFFFTLDKADELTNKHTMFGKVVGNTIYSMFSFPPFILNGLTTRRRKVKMLMIDLMDLTQLDVDENERPVK
jgi:cyclophilin family peptidyl-prolyl cis-trans isomerase